MTSRPLPDFGFTNIEVILPDGRVIGTSSLVLARSPFFRRHFRQYEQSLLTPGNATDDISSLSVSSSDVMTTETAATSTDYTLPTLSESQQSLQKPSPLRLEDHIQPLYLPRDSLSVAFEEILSFLSTDVLDWDESDLSSSPVTADFPYLSTSAPSTPLYSPTSTVVPSLPASPITLSFPSSPVTPVTPATPVTPVTSSSPSQLLHNLASSHTGSNSSNPPTLLAAFLLLSYRLELLPLLSHLESNFKSYLNDHNTVPLLNAFIQISTRDSFIPSSPDLGSLLTISTRFSGMCYRYLHAKSAFDDEEGFNTYKLGELKFKSVVFCLRLRRAYLDGQKGKPRGRSKGKGRVSTEGASRDKVGDGSGYRHLIKGENGEVRTLKFIESWVRHMNSDSEARRGAVNEGKLLRTNKDNASAEAKDSVSGREKIEIAIEQDKITGGMKADKAEGNETVIEKADVCTLETEQTDRPTIDAILEVGMKADNKNDFPMEKEIAENGNMVSDNDSKLHLEAIVDGRNAMSITENASVAQTGQSRLGTETQKESDVAEHDALSQDNVEVIEKGSTVANEQAMKQSAFIPHHILLDAMSLVLSDVLAQQAQSEQKSQSKTHRQESSSSSSSSARYQKEVKWREEAVRCIQDMKQELDICRAREKKLIESLMEERNRADGIMVGLLRLLIIVLMSYGIWYVFSLAMVRLPKALKRY